MQLEAVWDPTNRCVLYLLVCGSRSFCLGLPNGKPDPPNFSSPLTIILVKQLSQAHQIGSLPLKRAQCQTKTSDTSHSPTHDIALPTAETKKNCPQLTTDSPPTPHRLTTDLPLILRSLLVSSCTPQSASLSRLQRRISRCFGPFRP
jgi:hypothetical protein